MASISDIDESRRQFLLYLLASGGPVSAVGCSIGFSLATSDNLGTRETIVSEEPSAPGYMPGDASASQRIVPAPLRNHDDQELLLIETLVGRTTPYVNPRGVPRTHGSYC